MIQDSFIPVANDAKSRNDLVKWVQSSAAQN